MIKKNQKKLNFLHIVFDALIACMAYAAAWFLVIGRNAGSGGPGTLSPGVYFLALLVIVPLYLLLYALFDLYTPGRVRTRRSEFGDILKANVVGLMIFTFVLYAGRNIGEIGPYLRNFSFRMLVAFFVLNVSFEGVFRNVLRTFLRRMRAKGFNQKHILLVGISEAAEGFIGRVRQNPGWGYRIFGILDDMADKDSFFCGIRVIGSLSDLTGILEDNTLDEIAVTLPLDQYRQLKPVVAACEKSGVHTKFIPDYQDILPTTPYTEDLDGLPVVNIRRVPLTQPINAAMKRIFDLFGSLFLLVFFSPLMLAMAALIKLGSKGPVIYTQERVGLHNRPFKMYKFRSMYQQPPEDEATKWTVKGDPRITKIGYFMRHTNIDEMPQFFNVLKGDMSLIGPRPERPQFVEKFREEIPRYMVKHQVRPGMTGWAQVNGYRGDTSIQKRIEYDLNYIENWTPGLDLRILLMTVFKGFKNAY